MMLKPLLSGPHMRLLVWLAMETGLSVKGTHLPFNVKQLE